MTTSSDLSLWLTGDVMTGRGIDQILPHPGDPRLYEGYMDSAEGYVRLAETVHGPIPYPVDFAYVWGDALAELAEHAPDLRLINLETAVTTSEAAEPKGINYRMHPDNLPVLAAAGVDACTLANNHVLDWGEAGLLETLEALDAAGLRHVGAGRERDEATAPLCLSTPGGRVRLLSLGLPNSGVPERWEATSSRPGVDLLRRPGDAGVREVARRIRRRPPGELAVVSLHWGGNWGYALPAQHRAFAQRLIDDAGVDLVWGHSSHHPLGIEVHHGKLILYGCGDLINDYEGIGGHESYRGDLVLLYFPVLCHADGRLQSLTMVPMRLRRFRLERADEEATRWLCRVLDRESRPLGARVRLDQRERLVLDWSGNGE
ncbi:CapA family protein [Halomonas stenophila]|uniref:Poly-gamma-glutamate synthesis protein (Capsule biosynthesis protein) n=1 Tax=Halomonas stenophila TaxID=795312 RepID=A0A7W5HMQ0_9GAMM|nr:CapA family protein [Halomonas stenophila]MBB3232828.1 poly-gamma-glutamate synthesis protein (capsule biosynthesis protein) [Halomonas stenophila]